VSKVLHEVEVIQYFRELLRKVFDKAIVDFETFSLIVDYGEAVSKFQELFDNISEYRLDTARELAPPSRFLEEIARIYRRVILNLKINASLVEKEILARRLAILSLVTFISALSSRRYRNILEYLAMLIYGNEKAIGKLLSDIFRKHKFETSDSWLFRLRMIAEAIIFTAQVSGITIAEATTVQG